MIFPRIGDLQIQMGIGESYLGLALSGLPIGVQIALLFADKILSLFKPESLFIILSTAHFKFIAVGLEFINSLADVFKKD